MRLRSIMIAMFCIIAITPIGIFWFWPYSASLQSEIDDVRERHLVIAKNLAGAMERYHADLVTLFDYLAGDIENLAIDGRLNRIFDNLRIRHICVADLNTGKILLSLQSTGPRCPSQVPAKRFAWMKTQAIDGKTVLTGVKPTKLNGNVLYALRRDGNRLTIGAVSTDYLAELGKRVAFGKKGHAAIVDQNGHALSHPRADWQESRFDMSKLGVVQKMLTGGTGVEIFYSPALKADMIAGYTFVNGPGWGVMVPQPLAELESKATAIEMTAMTIMVFALLIAALLGSLGAHHLTRPLSRLVHAMERIGNGNLDALDAVSFGRFLPTEIVEARQAVGNMAAKLKDDIDTISRHAYLDTITGLPNRECFRALATQEIDTVLAQGKKGAMLFLDLDGFKQVNDIHGHRTGDDLLKLFATRSNNYCKKAESYLKSKGVKPIILPARLGGDEFVVLLGNLDGCDKVEAFASDLFTGVFGNFTLPNGLTIPANGSVGGSRFPEQTTSFDELLRLADIAMYQAKSMGKGRFVMYEPVAMKPRFKLGSASETAIGSPRAERKLSEDA